MLFKEHQSVPANTTESNPNWQKFRVEKGTIRQWIVFFDPESADLLHVRVFYQGSQILPFSQDKWLTAFFTDSPFEENIELNVPPYVLDIKAYNEDSRHPHEYFVHCVILRDQPVRPGSFTQTFMNRWRQMFGGGV